MTFPPSLNSLFPSHCSSLFFLPLTSANFLLYVLFWWSIKYLPKSSNLNPYPMTLVVRHPYLWHQLYRITLVYIFCSKHSTELLNRNFFLDNQWESQLPHAKVWNIHYPKSDLTSVSSLNDQDLNIHTKHWEFIPFCHLLHQSGSKFQIVCLLNYSWIYLFLLIYQPP